MVNNDGAMHEYDDKTVIPELRSQLGLSLGNGSSMLKKAYFSAPSIDINDYDRIVLCMSGGKDSIACLLNLIDIGVDLSMVELWHHDVDGREGSTLMDWPMRPSGVSTWWGRLYESSLSISPSNPPSSHEK